MSCEYCEAAIPEFDETCPFCGGSSALPSRQPAGMMANYASRPFPTSPETKVRAKRGFGLQSNGLPMPPVATDSAARPMDMESSPQTRTEPHEERIRAPWPDSEIAAGSPMPGFAPEPEFPPGLAPEPEFPPEFSPVPNHLAFAAMQPRRQRTPLRIAMAACLLLGGAAIGIGGGWWLNESMNSEPDASPYATTRNAAALPPIPAASAGERDAIPRRSEPTGQPLASAASEPQGGNMPAEARQLPQASAAPETEAVTAPKSGKEATAARKEAAPAQPAPLKAQARKPFRKSGKPTVELANRSEEMSFARSRAQARKSFRRPRKPPVEMADRGDEIDRLKSQAFSETAQDRIGPVIRPAPPNIASDMPSGVTQYAPPPQARPQHSPGARNLVSQCDHITNFFRHEQCKWRVCDGKWGQYGCPARARNELTPS